MHHVKVVFKILHQFIEYDEFEDVDVDPERSIYTWRYMTIYFRIPNFVLLDFHILN